MMDELAGKILVGYGLGICYNSMKSMLPFRLQYLADRNYDEIGSYCDGLPVIAPEQLKELDNAFALVFTFENHIYQSISQDLNALGIPHAPVQKYVNSEIIVTGQDLIVKYPNGYQDAWGNEITYDKSIICKGLRVRFRGKNNKLVIAKNTVCRELSIFFGSFGECRIGEGSEIMEARIYATNGRVEIGEECLISFKVLIMNHDYHHIFDKKSGRRINYSKDIRIGNHVWIGEGAGILAGFAIGDNSIVGAMSISSSKFDRNVIIAGNPARIIREDVIWSRDNTECFQWDVFEQCYNRKAELYE